MGIINGSLRTVNGGIVEKINGMEIEILSHNFHNPYCDIVCGYFMEGNTKVELTYYKDIEKNIVGTEIYKFKSKEGTQHYYSRNYKNEVPKKYGKFVEKLKEVHKIINFEKYKIRTV